MSADFFTQGAGVPHYYGGARMRQRNGNALCHGRHWGEKEAADGRNVATPGTLGIHGRMACFCGALERRGLFTLCSTCARFDQYAREVQLLQRAGYRGFAT